VSTSKSTSKETLANHDHHAERETPRSNVGEKHGVARPEVPAGTSRRRRSPKHPGVVLIKPDLARRIGWRARYTDPDSGRQVKETLDASLTTVEARDDWAVRKSRALARRRLELEGGAPPTTGTALSDALDRYFKDHPHLKARTRQIYRAVADKLIEHCGRRFSADALNGPRLMAFRSTLMRETRRVHVRGGKRGALKATNVQRAPATVNAELRALGTVLGYLRRLGLLPRLTSDALRDGLQKLKAPPKRIHYLKPHELQKLLDAGLRHDADTFAATREEHAGKREPGTTPRYTPITTIVAAALMTGMRFGALVDLQWDHVDLEALDHDGRVVGEIVPPGGSHTKRTGVIGLEVSPALRKMLAAMQLRTVGKGSVFGLTRDEANAALRRLAVEYGGPSGSTWQTFRRTCGTYLTNAPGIFGAASAYRSAKQLGHSVAVAERHYVDLIRGIPPTARTLEAAMQVEQQMARVVDVVTAPAARARSAQQRRARSKRD